MSYQQLLQIKEILENHIGKENQISAGTIGPLIGVYEDHTHKKARQLILEAIKKFNLPVAGGNKGYYLLRNEEEFEDYKNSIIRRTEKTIENRVNTVDRAFRDYYE